MKCLASFRGLKATSGTDHAQQGPLSTWVTQPPWLRGCYYKNISLYIHKVIYSYTSSHTLKGKTITPSQNLQPRTCTKACWVPKTITICAPAHPHTSLLVSQTRRHSAFIPTPVTGMQTQIIHCPCRFAPAPTGGLAAAVAVTAAVLKSGHLCIVFTITVSFPAVGWFLGKGTQGEPLYLGPCTWETEDKSQV